MGWVFCGILVDGRLSGSSGFDEDGGGESQSTFKTLLLCPSNVRMQVYVLRDQSLTERSPDPLTRSPLELLPASVLMGGVSLGAKRMDQTPRLWPHRSSLGPSHPNHSFSPLQTKSQTLQSFSFLTFLNPGSIPPPLRLRRRHHNPLDRHHHPHPPHRHRRPKPPNRTRPSLTEPHARAELPRSDHLGTPAQSPRSSPLSPRRRDQQTLLHHSCRRPK